MVRLHVETKGASLNTLVVCYYPTSLKLKSLFFKHTKDKRAYKELCMHFGSNTFTVSTSNTLNINSIERTLHYLIGFLISNCAVNEPFLNGM